jgi:Asp-tRNA(Asn)/Glu-tRNA(Gln) amidotransferase A subunit family amidase
MGGKGMTFSNLISKPPVLGVVLTFFLIAPVRNAHAQSAVDSLTLMEATISQLQAALVSGTISSRDLVAMYLARIEAYDKQGPSLNAISVINPKALDEAGKMDSERKVGKMRGPLHGIPIIVKDNYDTIGMQTADGSILLAGWAPPDDAELVARLRKAGAIIIAKSNMHEFAYGITTVGSLFGTVRNPYNLERNSGGSSGGTGAAIAANFAAAGMGSDTCGSIRIPAAQNNLTGIRGTQGLSSRAGIIPFSSTQDIGGPIARNVTDLAIILDATVGYDPKDPQTATSVGNIPSTYRAGLQVDALRGRRIGILNELFGSDLADQPVGVILVNDMAALREAGAETVDIVIPKLADLLTDPIEGYLVSVHDFKFDFDEYLRSHPTAPVHSLAEVVASGKADPSVQSDIVDSEAVTTRDSLDYLRALARRGILQQAILKVMADYRLDAIAYPTIRRTAALIGEEQLGENCKLASNSGLPAISVQGGFTSDGLPVGLEMLGRPWSEATLLALAFGFEEKTHYRRPPGSTPPLR